MTSSTRRDTDRPPSPASSRSARRRGAGALAASILAGSAVIGLTGLGTDAARAEEPRYREVIQHCDATACLFAWTVVDSDGDGVSDADEWMAGSDPHDPSSRPPVRVLVDLLGKRQLPSFENGFASLVVMPADLVERREAAVGEGRLKGLLFDGFPVAERGDALSRLGISKETMAEYGIDIGRDAFTLGLEPPSKDDGGLPPLRVGGVDLSTISAGGKGPKDPPATTPPSSAPPATSPPASTPASTPSSQPSTGATTPASQPAGGSSGGTDDLTPLPNLNPGEPVGTQKLLGITFNHYADGTIIAKGLGQTTYYYPAGGHETFPDKPKKHYENPDAQDAMVIDPAAFEQWQRVAGAAERTVEGWRAPRTDGELPPPRGTLIALIDADLARDSIVVFDEIRITTAQPETRPDLPNVFRGAPPGGIDGAPGGCVDGYCAG
jgi:hypothetical protein